MLKRPFWLEKELELNFLRLVVELVVKVDYLAMLAKE